MTEERKHRGPTRRMTERVAFAATPEDLAIIARIAQHYRDDSDSAAMRRCLRLVDAHWTQLTAGQPAQAS